MVKISRPTTKDAYPRQRLFERLDQLRSFPVTWISAPAGSGKTTLVSSYVVEQNSPCLWYQIDRGDCDAATFFYYLGLAAKKCAPGKRMSLPLLTPEYLLGVPTFALRYFEQLYKRLKPHSILVFDNYHEAPLDSPLHEVMCSALSRIPEGINVVVISRTDPPPELARLRANSSLALVRWEDLRLTEDEARGIVAGRIDTSYPEDKMQRLYELSDGWAAGLVLLSEAAREDVFKPEFAEKLTCGEVFDYFATEVFLHLDATSMEFFLTTAFLPKMTVAMAEQLTGNRAAGSILNTMYRNNYFVAKHSDSDAVYEYHPLYRDFLLSQARAALPSGTVTAIRRSAALILEKAGMTEAAVKLLNEISDWNAMVCIIMTHAAEMLKQGRHRPLQTWLENLPAVMMESNPWLNYWHGMSIMPFSPAQARLALEKAFAGSQSAGDDFGAMLSASGVIYSILCQFADLTPLDHWYAVLNDLALRIDAFPDEEMEAVVLTSLIMAMTLREVCSNESETWEQRALKITETPATINLKFLALRMIFYGRWIIAGEVEALFLLHELRRLSSLPAAQPLTVITAHSVDVQFYLCTGLHDELMEAVRKGLDLASKTGIHIEDMWFYLYAAASFVDRMDCRGALEWLDRLPPMAEGLPSWPKALYHFQLARISLIRKEYDQALHEGRKAIDLASRAGSQLAVASTNLLLAQVLRAIGKRGEAMEHLEKGRSYADQNHSRSIMNLVLMIDAQLAFDDGDDARGLLHLGKTLALARECGMLTTAYDDPVSTVRMCEKALEAGIEVETVREIIRRRALAPETPPIHIENWPWQHRIYTLGKFTLEKDGKPFGSSGKVQKKPLEILKCLVALGGEEAREGQIADLLWPDAEGDTARNSFKVNLYRLRELTGAERALSLKEGCLTMDRRFFWVDVWAFESLLANAQSKLESGDEAVTIYLTKKALSLYRGSFLGGDNANPWSVSMRARLKSRFIRNVSVLGSLLQQMNDHNQAIAIYLQGLEVDDLVEEFYQNLMKIYLAAGLRAEAIGTFERCRKSLAVTLGIAPSSTSVEIYQTALKG